VSFNSFIMVLPNFISRVVSINKHRVLIVNTLCLVHINTDQKR
jgi:hypothetical protein